MNQTITYDTTQIAGVMEISPVPPTTDCSAGGDSGSIWLSRGGTHPRGLHFAGQGSLAFAQEWKRVVTALNLADDY